MSTKFQATTLALAVSVALGSSASYAAESDTEVKEKSVERIAVVGSRSAPRSVADSPVPVDIIGGNELGKNASSDMLDMLVGAIPSFNARTQPISDAASLIRPVNLRGLPSDSTLVLVNGKRRHRASVIAFQGGGINDGAQGPDISVIPSAALKQVEVLRDGAAAQYGSDAIAGVMNFVLKDDADGGSLSVKRGEYYEGDGSSTIVDGNIGMPFTKDGFVNLSFQYKNADATSRSVQRPDAQRLIDAGNSAVANPAQIWGNPEVNDDITLFGNVGLDLGDDKEFYMFGNYSERDVKGGFYYRNPEDRGGVFADRLNLVDNNDASGSGKPDGMINDNDDWSHLRWLVGDVSADGSGGCPAQGKDIGDPLVLAKGGFLSDLAVYDDVMANNNCWSTNKLYPGGYTPSFGGNITDTALTIGTKGDIKSGVLADWYFDLSAAVGRSESSFNLKQSLNPSLGFESPTEFNTGKYIQLEKTFNFDLVRGFDVGLYEDLNFATGLEWREETFEIIAGDEASWKAGPLAEQGFSIGSHGFKGFGPESQGTNTRRNIAGYVDVEAYITEDFLLGAALRYEDFTSFGSTLNYKLTAQLSISEELSFRASHSTGFRAPTVGQANVVNTQTSIVNGDLIQTFLAPPTDPLSAFYGGKELDPEESVSYAIGAVYQEGDLFMTIDYYNIEVTDRIAQSSQILVKAEDHAKLEALGVSNPELISGVTFYANDFDTTTQGVDIVGNYAMELLGGDTSFSLAYNWNKTSVDKFNPKTTDVGKVRRLEEGTPEHRATFTIAQSWDDVSMFVRANYFGEYFAVHADDAAPGGWNEVGDSAITLDTEVSYFINNSITLSAGANNLLDQDAHKLPADSYGAVGAKFYESGAFDYNGGFYYVKATYNF